ncbi:MAG: HD domain-containing protein [Clostridia bacterium]|nr:HD domain-containing protein [Clostridia bacterium]
MSFLKISDDAAYILEQLEAAGFSAYIAGGAVRDLLMGKPPHDFDIATSALPNEVKALFKRTIDTGLKHGTVTVIKNKVGYEVTTYRMDGDYTDGRHPNSVIFMDNIKDDLSRRDFTVNAMAYSPRRGLADFYGGKKDIENKIIRCVGDPEKRFLEDALRMLRAVRFSAVLGFEIEESTKKAIVKCAPLIRRISGERIRDELNKILLSPRPHHIILLHELGLLRYIMNEFECCFGTNQKNKYHIYDVGEHIIETIKNTPNDLILRWAALFHDIGKPNCASVDHFGVIHFYGHHKESLKIANDVLHRLHFDNDSISAICILVENHDVRIDPSAPAVKRMMARTGEELFDKLLALQEADSKAKNPNFLAEKLERINNIRYIYKNILAENQPYLISSLAVNGKDLLKIGYKPGRELGDALRILLDDVVINPELNNREYLIKRAKILKKKKGNT